MVHGDLCLVHTVDRSLLLHDGVDGEWGAGWNPSALREKCTGSSRPSLPRATNAVLGTQAVVHAPERTQADRDLIHLSISAETGSVALLQAVAYLLFFFPQKFIILI